MGCSIGRCQILNFRTRYVQIESCKRDATTHAPGAGHLKHQGTCHGDAWSTIDWGGRSPVWQRFVFVYCVRDGVGDEAFDGAKRLTDVGRPAGLAMEAAGSAEQDDDFAQGLQSTREIAVVALRGLPAG